MHLAPNRKSEATRPALIVVGNGMVGARFCERAVQAGLHRSHAMAVIGEEPRPAYNRVRLSSYASHREASRLELLSAGWYAEYEIELVTGTAVSGIDRISHRVVFGDGEEESLHYDKLVLAMGSSPFVPPIPGTDLDGVFVYRTIEDLEAICARAPKCRFVAVLGGGLLGLEAAQAVQSLGVREVHVIELARFLMPQQLNETASGILRNEIEGQGIRVHLETKTVAIQKTGRRLILCLESAGEMEADMVIFSAGIRPRTELASAAGLETGVRGGVIVNDCLQSSDPDIYAIGECALHRDRIYGLVSPGYQMAGVLAEHLAGKKSAAFKGADLSTRLKMLGVDVVTIGAHLQPGDAIEFSRGSVYRRLVFDKKGRLSGALGVGAWPEAGRIQTAVNRGIKVSRKQRGRFAETGGLWDTSDALPVSQWPAGAMICNCMQVTKGELCAAIAKGKTEVEELRVCTGASSVCGSCRPLLAELTGIPDSEPMPAGYRWLMAMSAVALLLGVLTLLAKPLPAAESVEAFWHRVDALWRNGVYKQISGFSLLGVSLAGLVLSLRKRFKWFSFGHFSKWRVLHTVFGVAALVVLFAHTGFHFGTNLNFWLMFTFISLSILGGVAGMVSAIETRGTGRWAFRARRWRPALTWAHLVMFWPFPVLLAFHILSVYRY